jgi:hypothetical protein
MATVGLLMSTASADYYIVQEQATKKCKVVETKPTERPLAFKTQAEAEKQIKTVCVEKRKFKRCNRLTLQTLALGPRAPLVSS